MQRPEGIILRRFRDGDFDAFHAIVSDFDVVKNTASWPSPADPEFTRMRLNTPEAQAGLINAIEVDGQFAGSIGLANRQLGYMLGRAYWGQGIATEAVRQKLDAEYRASDLDWVEAGAFTNNPASQRVLQKHGFNRTCDKLHDCRALGAQQNCAMHRLTRQDWINTQPMRIVTDRLVLEPFAKPDAKAFSAQMDTGYVTNVMATIPAPFDKAAAETWIAGRIYAATPGFALKISRKDGTLIGFVYLHDQPIYVAYAIGEAFKGQGYATEAAHAFITECCQRFGLSDITAGAFADNFASQAVLSKLGFKQVGERTHKTSTRLEPETLYLYRFTRNMRKHHEIS